jgi:CDP-diacylglycerol--glycerol-3-phosphate 3-phosphatidyltransferase
MGSNLSAYDTNLFLLRRRWWLVTAFYTVSILGFSWLLQFTGTNLYAKQWLGQTAVIAAYCLWIVWRYLPENHPADSTQLILPTFGWGNRLTILRGLLISMLAGFLFIPWPADWLAWMPALLYTIASIADFIDGYAARKTDHVTQLGARLDMEFDGMGMFFVTVLAVWFAQLPWWYLLIGLARYFFIFGLWLRKKRHLPICDMPHSWHRRIFAGFQMGFMSVVLWPIVPAWGATIAGTLFALATSTSFLRDWLIIIGWLDPNSTVYQSRQHQIYRLFSFYIPPVLRLIFAACAVILIGQIDMPWQPTGWAALFSGWHLPFPAALASFLAMMGLVAAVMITVGAMGRIMALLILFPLGFDMIVTGPNWVNTIAMSCVIVIMMLGTGAFSLWQPEEHFMYRRAGE